MAQEHNHEDEEKIINLTDENGNIEEFEIVLSFDHEEQEYAVLYPTSGDEEEAVIFKIVDGEDEVIFENLTDEEFEKISKIYYELVNENE
ncbi:MAG: DUF1292 domain-containing protein [Clostridiales bacterium]|nr:DUF1292 domain-containing protein [Clostridiales bacterium]